MINEQQEISDILNGRRIDPRHTYRTCYLLAKHWKEQGCSMPETVENIFNFGKTHNVYFTQNIVNLAQKAYTDNKPLRGEAKIYVSQHDLDIIRQKFFGKKNESLIAFAFLMYAKMFADENGKFNISMVGFSQWVGISKNHIYSRYLKNLIMMEYIRYSDPPTTRFLKRSHQYISKPSSFQILVPFSNKRSAKVFNDKNLRAEFADLFYL